MKIVNEQETAQRVDVLLARANPSYSRAALAKLFDMGKINKGEKILKAGDKIQPGFEFEADISPINAIAEDIDMPIIFEDENVIVVDKPTGVISHARGKYWDEASVASFVRAKVADLTGERAGIVHRLDRATSGVMICGKNPETMSFLQKQFSQRKVKKQYVAVVGGIVNPTEATIDVPLARNPKDPKSFRPDELGRSATTQYTVLQQGKKTALVNLAPYTGRTHQIRVHMQYIEHPIVGDVLYGGKKAERLFLHATSLEITLPGGKRTVFESKLPSNFIEQVK
jgi:23S rRNA pseudouridine1911/1915/1917 synthase